MIVALLLIIVIILLIPFIPLLFYILTRVFGWVIIILSVLWFVYRITS